MPVDRHMNFTTNVKNSSRIAMYHFKNINHIRSLLSDKTAEQLIHALVTPRLDYCNSLLYGLPASTLHHLQRIQNIAARILTRSKKFEHITPVLQALHWLPVEQRIIFKLLCTTYRCMTETSSPLYLQRLLLPYKPVRQLRSSDANLLAVPPSRLKAYGDGSFSVAAPPSVERLASHP